MVKTLSRQSNSMAGSYKPPAASYAELFTLIFHTVAIAKEVESLNGASVRHDDGFCPFESIRCVVFRIVVSWHQP